MNFTSVEFDSKELSVDASNMLSVTLESGEELYHYLLLYIAKNLTGKGQNLYTNVLSKREPPSEFVEKNVYGRVVLKLGTGEYAFKGYDGTIFHALHHQIGEPVGTDCSVQVMRRLIIFTDATWDVLGGFLNAAVEQMQSTSGDKFICYTWKIRYGYWHEETRVNKRPIASVVLPTTMKDRIVTDMTKFLDPRTKEFYLRNGIPYRRSYLFYGIPGAGKTSMVQALAANFERNVCFLMPTHPEMTDDGLRQAVNSIPENSIVVFEDIDALFDKSRANKVKASSLTFSGLLNALDGIGSSNGQVFVLTTNLRENLDHALIRNGRVDLHFEFTYAVAEQMELMWSNFYPTASHLAVPFATAVMDQLSANNMQIATSALQHFFVTQMDSTPEEALGNVSLIVEEVRLNSSNSMLKEAAKEGSDSNEPNKKAKKNKKGSTKGENQPKDQSANGKKSSEVSSSEPSGPAETAKGIVDGSVQGQQPVQSETMTSQTKYINQDNNNDNKQNKKKNNKKNKNKKEKQQEASPVTSAKTSDDVASPPIIHIPEQLTATAAPTVSVTNEPKKEKTNSKGKRNKDSTNVENIKVEAVEIPVPAAVNTTLEGTDSKESVKKEAVEEVKREQDNNMTPLAKRQRNKDKKKPKSESDVSTPAESTSSATTDLPSAPI